VQVDSIKTRVESAPGVCNQRLKLKCDEPLSNVAFNFNVRRYNVDDQGVETTSEPITAHKVGRCRLIVSKPELKARQVSAIETKV
jgi:hypothetical protein